MRGLLTKLVRVKGTSVKAVETGLCDRDLISIEAVTPLLNPWNC